MSHDATSWAFRQKGLRPSAKLVLLALADCHNPVYGCFPSQAFLADVCEINRDTVNEALTLLEALGLIRRERSVDPVTRRQRSTRYKLAFEADFDMHDAAENPVSEIPTQTPKAVSDFPAEPCRKKPESRVGNSDTNLVREPLREPVSARPHSDGSTGSGNLVAFELFWQTHPKPRNRERSLALWLGAEKSGIDTQRIIDAAKRYRDGSKGKDSRYLAAADNWLEQRRWEDAGGQSRPAMSLDEKAIAITATAEMLAERVRAGANVAPSAWTRPIVEIIRAKSLLTADQMHRIGLKA